MKFAFSFLEQTCLVHSILDTCLPNKVAKKGNAFQVIEKKVKNTVVGQLGKIIWKGMWKF